MIRLTLRRNRAQLPIWILSIAFLWVVSSNAIRTEYGDTDAERGKLFSAVVLNPTVRAMRGTAEGPGQSALAYFQVFTFVAVLAGLMNTFLATRSLRADEERGRLELIGSTSISRTAPLRAVLVVGAGADAAVMALSAAVMLAVGFDPWGSVLAGAATGLVGLAFLGLGALASQVMPTGRAANTTGVALVLGAYLLRALGDAFGTVDLRRLTETVAWPSWLSPIGWAQQVSPFTRQDPAPLLLLVALALLAGGAAVALQKRRDLGASIVPEGAGRAEAHGYLASPVALLWRQNWRALIGWLVAGALLGGIAGALSSALSDAVAGTRGVGRVLASLAAGSSGSITDTFVVAIAAMAGLVACAAALQTLLRMRGEEADGRAELLLAAPVTRVGWLLGSLAIATLSAALVTLTAGVVAGLSFLGLGASTDRVGSSILAGVAQLPMIASFLGIAALAIAVLPRAAIAVAWGALAVGYLIGPLGGILQLPQWIRDLSPFEHTPQIPGPSPDWGPATIVLAVGVVLAVVATAAMTRRELTA